MMLSRRAQRGRAGLDAGTAILKIQGSGAWVQLRRRPDGRAELEMRDERYDWLRPVTSELEIVLGADGWFLGGLLPEEVSAVELVTATDRRLAQTGAGVWLGSLSREQATAALEVVYLGRDARRINSIDIDPLEDSRPPVGVPSEELAPERAPLTLRPSTNRRELGWLLVCAAFAVGGAVQVALGQSVGWLPASFFTVLGAYWICWIASGWGGLRLDEDGFGWGGPFRKRYRWSDVQAFMPIGKEVGFKLRGPTPGGSRLLRWMTGMDAQLPSGYALEPPELAALMNTWWDHYLVTTPHAF